jgi:hypothetical protein
MLTLAREIVDHFGRDEVIVQIDNVHGGAQKSASSTK